jgi:sugar lactone lactonase YvrE
MHLADELAWSADIVEGGCTNIPINDEPLPLPQPNEEALEHLVQAPHHHTWNYTLGVIFSVAVAVLAAVGFVLAGLRPAPSPSVVAPTTPSATTAALPPCPPPRATPAPGAPPAPQPGVDCRARMVADLPLTRAGDIAVDSSGTVYATDGGHELIKLPAGSNTPVVLPLNDHGNVIGVAVDTAHNVYLITLKSNVVGGPGGEVLELPAGSDTPIVLPFTGGKYTSTGAPFPTGLAVDTAGDVYITDVSENLLELPARSTSSVEIPMPRNKYVGNDIAFDGSGNLYFTDTTRGYAFGPGTGHVYEVPARSNTLIELPFPGIHELHSMTVDTTGNVYVTDYEIHKAADWTPDNLHAYTDNHRVLELPAGSSTTPIQLPFADRGGYTTVTADTVGNVYVTDDLGVRVLKVN